MKKARAYLKNAFNGIVDAGTIDAQSRPSHIFRCLQEDCPATLHWVREHARLENTKRVGAHFARNPSSKHAENCRYDYEATVSRHRELTYLKDGQLHLRVNFPLGAAWSDTHQGRGALTKRQRQAAENNAGIRSIGSMAALLAFINKELGGLESDQLDDLVLDYQGERFPWAKLFIDADSGEKLWQAATASTDRPEPRLLLLTPLREKDPNPNGKRRFDCGMLESRVQGENREIHVTITCETDEIARLIRIGQPALTTARPYVPPARTTLRPGQKDIYVTLSLASPLQLAPIHSEEKPAPAPPYTPSGRPREQLSLFTENEDFGGCGCMHPAGFNGF